MTLKYINYSVDMYGTSAITTNTYQTVFTGDEDSVQLKFSITDEEDLTGATALIHLYFGDSSHFERTCTPITGGFQYTLTGTENDHAGVTRVDIYITKAGAKFTRAGYKFRIDKSLEASAPLVEYAVETVDTVVKEAGDWLLQAQTDFGTAQDTRAAEWVTDNDTRADEFTAAQTSRATTFGESEASRASTFNTNETGRSNTFTTNENARQAAAEANQAQAATDHTTAEADHDIAIADSSMASSDHATATTDHSTAVIDHSTASADHTAALADQEIVDGLQDQFNDVIANATVDSEVINARQGSATLSQNLLSIKSELAETETLVTQNKRPSHAFNSLKIQKPMVTFIDDDGCVEVLTKLKPLVIAKGIPYTLAIISDKMASATGDTSFMGYTNVVDLHKNFGFEITSHSKTHQAMSGQSEADQLIEVRESYERLNELGLNAEYIVYPYGSNDKSVRSKVSKYYKGAIGTNANLNTMPLQTFNLYRIPLGYAAPVGSDTLAYYKSRVDEAIANNSWVIFMTHVANPAHTAEQQQHLSDLIDYIQTTTAKIVTVKEGYETIGNLMDIGDYTDSDYQYISADATNNTNNYLHLKFDPTTGAEPITADTVPNALKKNKTYVNQIYRGVEIAKFPIPLAGVLTTVITDDYSKSYQTYQTQNVSYKRGSNADGSAWGEFYRLMEATQGIFAVTETTIPANSYVSKGIASGFYNFLYMPLFTPKVLLPDGVTFEVHHNGSYGNWVLTLINSSTSQKVVSAGDWAYMLIRI